MLFDRRREQSAGVVHAARLFVQSRYFARGFTESRRFGAPQLHCWFSSSMKYKNSTFMKVSTFEFSGATEVSGSLHSRRNEANPLTCFSLLFFALAVFLDPAAGKIAVAITHHFICFGL